MKQIDLNSEPIVNPVQWADYFPQMKALPTSDRRVFMTPFEKVSSPHTGSLSLEGTKRKTYFCCIIGGNCFGVDVLRPIAVNSATECTEAFEKVKFAADFYEQNNRWPKEHEYPTSKETS